MDGSDTTTMNPSVSDMEQEKVTLGRIKSVEKAGTHFELQFDTGELGRLYMLDGHIFRYYVSKGDFHDFPTPHNEEDLAKIVIKSVDSYNTIPFELSTIDENDKYYIIAAEHIEIHFDKDHATMMVKDKRNGKIVLQEAKPIKFSDTKTTQVLVHHRDEHFFGGGMQNGRFAHKGEIIRIVNTNNWEDGGVTSPNPFYWSTYGYGILRNTWKPGTYDFGSKPDKRVRTTHQEEYFDAFYFISHHPKDILLDYFRLTGRPILLPEYALYEAHLNAFNRDYWVLVTADTPGAILYEDGEYYKSYQPAQLGNRTGILESLNGELNNYQFSARAMIDRYQRHDMPLGWFVPNDGYGSGYGQTDSLQGDIKNLKEFADYSRANGVEVALWTESNLEPEDPEHPKKGERDLAKEVAEADVVALKCDVAWIGYGYSFGLNAVENATKMFDVSTKRGARPFIIMVDGWAGTQRYAGIWSGDQSGGEWEYIRFHIPTYVGTGLSGQPVVGSDMDGIYRGGDKVVNIRDYQWKAFTPLQLNMDGWGSVPKTPFSFDEQVIDINRAYLKLKSMLMPYTYSINYESIRGLPMVRAMFLEFPEETPAYTDDSKYQYMWGPNILVAPVYDKGPLRNGIYLPYPNQVWIDFFTGEMYQGGKIYNNFETPLWKIPVFIKNGAIIPMTPPNNNPYEIQRDVRIFNLYPSGETSFEVYEDDGISVDYTKGYFANTKIKMALTETSSKESEPSDLFISIEKTEGKYKGMVKERTTLIRIMTSIEPKEVELMSGGDYITLNKTESDSEFDANEDVYFLKDNFVVNPYLQDIAAQKLEQKFLLIKLKKIDVTTEKVHLKITGFANRREVFGEDLGLSSTLSTPTNFTEVHNETSPTSVTLSWDELKEAAYYEIERDGFIFSNIKGTKFTFNGFKYATEHSFRIRAVNDGLSEWSDVVTAVTKDDPYKNTVKDVKVSCNLPCQPSQEICKLTDGDVSSLWHTHWGIPGKANPNKGHVLKLNFDLGKLYDIEKLEYVPREDAGNGTFLQIQYKHSSDGSNWTPLSENINWNPDSSIKTIELDATFRFHPKIKNNYHMEGSDTTTLNPSLLDVKQERVTLGRIKSVAKTGTNFELQYDTGEIGRLYMLDGHIFRYYVSKGNFNDFPTPDNEEDLAKIVIKSVDSYNTIPFELSTIDENDKYYIIDAEHIKIHFDKDHATMMVKDKRNGKIVLQEAKPLKFSNRKTTQVTQVLVHHRDEHFFGGGMQNGRFAHKGEIIRIVNTDNWEDGGVTSPNPFYWSTYGYGILRNTWKPGTYDFGSKPDKRVRTTHQEEYFDAFYFISHHPKDILLDYFRLTGRPILLPEYALYEAHLNAFNRDYWVLVKAGKPGAILYEDGKYYKSYHPDKLGNRTGILESLNGELNNYQFSARAMIDRYQRHDMPLGWFVPNDGYGSGYGQTDSLQGDLKNLKVFADYSRENGVEVALWTESNLEPEDPQHPKKGERDLAKEIAEADVVALKCDVAWIGDGYSSGLNAVGNATKIFDVSTKRGARPFIIMVDGWAGTQRYAGIWSGDQSGGEWEYIRFHIPTYVGTGLSGQPIVGSDMDGILYGGDKEVNIRDYQWKAFTPLQLNMDGWGSVPKTPFSFDEQVIDINRAYLKLKSMLMPYTYSINYESIRGLPMVRAMFLEFPEETPAYTDDSKYQYMWGPNILVAPVYDKGPLRNGVYLPYPNQVWIDFFTGEMYQGGKIYNNFETPLWKIPVFIKNGAIIPMTPPNNNPYEIQRDVRIFNLYPSGETSFEVYEDDGISVDYTKGYFANTKIKMALTETGSKESEPSDLFISIEKTEGKYKGMVKERTTLIRIMTSIEPKEVELMSGGDYITLNKTESDSEFDANEDVYFLKDNFVVNPYLPDIAAQKLEQKFIFIKLKKIDVTTEKVHLKITGFANRREVFGEDLGLSSTLSTPTNFTEVHNETSPTSVTLSWDELKEAAYYEIERDGFIFSNIKGIKFTFNGFKYATEHSFRIRAVNDGLSEWSDVVTAVTKDDPYKNTVKDVKVSCNLPCQPSQEICKLTDGDVSSLWHTHWGIPGKANPNKGHVLKLNFDLGKLYDIEKLEYVPREDAGNGTFLQIQYKHSSDGSNWTPLSENINWSADSSIKTIKLDATFRYIQLRVLESIGNFGSGKLIHFYKKI